MDVKAIVVRFTADGAIEAVGEGALITAASQIALADGKITAGKVVFDVYPDVRDAVDAALNPQQEDTFLVFAELDGVKPAESEEVVGFQVVVANDTHLALVCKTDTDGVIPLVSTGDDGAELEVKCRFADGTLKVVSGEESVTEAAPADDDAGKAEEAEAAPADDDAGKAEEAEAAPADDDAGKAEEAEAAPADDDAGKAEESMVICANNLVGCVRCCDGILAFVTNAHESSLQDDTFTVGIGENDKVAFDVPDGNVRDLVDAMMDTSCTSRLTLFLKPEGYTAGEEPNVGEFKLVAENETHLLVAFRNGDEGRFCFYSEVDSLESPPIELEVFAWNDRLYRQPEVVAFGNQVVLAHLGYVREECSNTVVNWGFSGEPSDRNVLVIGQERYEVTTKVVEKLRNWIGAELPLTYAWITAKNNAVLEEGMPDGATLLWRDPSFKHALICFPSRCDGKLYFRSSADLDFEIPIHISPEDGFVIRGELDLSERAAVWVIDPDETPERVNEVPLLDNLGSVSFYGEKLMLCAKQQQMLSGAFSFEGYRLVLLATGDMDARFVTTDGRFCDSGAVTELTTFRAPEKTAAVLLPPDTVCTFQMECDGELQTYVMMSDKGGNVEILELEDAQDLPTDIGFGKNNRLRVADDAGVTIVVAAPNDIRIEPAG